MHSCCMAASLQSEMTFPSLLVLESKICILQGAAGNTGPGNTGPEILDPEAQQGHS